MLNVSIVTYHTDPDELRRCLASLGSPCVNRIYIIDNSRSESTRLITESHGNVTYIPNDNTGYGAGHNIALRRTIESGEAAYHLVVNSDVRFDPEILPRMLAEMEKFPGVGQMHPKVLNPDGSMQWTVRRLPTPLDLLGRRFLPRPLMRRRDDRYLLKHIDHTEPFNVPYHQGSFMLLRVEALKRVGLFDERFFMYPEDIDLTRRIHRHYVTLYWPYAEVIHDHRAQSYASWRMLRIHLVNMARYFCKWGWFIDPERRRLNCRLNSPKPFLQHGKEA